MSAFRHSWLAQLCGIGYFVKISETRVANSGRLLSSWSFCPFSRIGSFCSVVSVSVKRAPSNGQHRISNGKGRITGAHGAHPRHDLAYRSSRLTPRNEEEQRVMVDKVKLELFSDYV